MEEQEEGDDGEEEWAAAAGEEEEEEWDGGEEEEDKLLDGYRPRPSSRRRAYKRRVVEDEDEDYEEDSEEERRPSKRGRKAAAPAAPAPPPDALSVFVKQLKAIVAAVLRQPNAAVFKARVNTKTIADYNDFVAPEDEMWLDKILEKANAGWYVTVDAFRADMQQLVTNAQAYNGPDGGAQRYPLIIQTAQNLLDRCDAELTRRTAVLAEAQAAIALQLEPEQAPAEGQETDQWVACAACEEWRQVPDAHWAAIQAAGDDEDWFCKDAGWDVTKYPPYKPPCDG